ncbi:metalloregulator ArsR/SmtB family transcription factor [Aquibium sp. A9E412]|uniref:ArsR/SmtB family transcription factor n=1 Tax=Aquibium sp. A9E412 TaxID=2976767 RepID=UPI0025B047AD|nr:metalloregulator ArsR/SmtB family transcription factor [Aquibium sp. A9E412]MDN2567708.1 metalloregulator ArsR/SmtB family transcription factor [Aquibium sp. A9E412]
MNCEPAPAADCPAAQPLAAGLAALAHPARIEILCHLAGCGGCGCMQVVERMDLAQSTVSQHLKVLVEAGLVRAAPRGQRLRYTVDRAALSALAGAFSDLAGRCCRRHDASA